MKIEEVFSELIKDDQCSFGRLFNKSRNNIVCGVTNDSRKVKPGFIYVAIKGSKANGEDFIESALKRGAEVIVRSSGSGGQVSCEFADVCVPDARIALARLASRFHGYPADSLHMTGITGTNGKTTVAYLVHSVFDAVGKKPGLLTTVECRIGERVIPSVRTTMDASDLQMMLSDMRKAGCQSVVMEVSSHAIDQSRVAFIDYDIAVFTNLTRDHLDYHLNMDGYSEVKKKLFAGLGRAKKKAFAVINIDDDLGKELLGYDSILADKISYGIDGRADVSADDLVLSGEGTSFNLNTPWGNGRMISGLLGRYNVSNLLAAAAVCGVSGIGIDDTVSVLSRVDKIPGRLEEIKVNAGGYQVFVDYAHTDDALDKVLTTLQEITSNRVIVVFGCGGDRDKSKRAAMGRVAAKAADYSILTSDNPRNEDVSEIIREIESGFVDCGNYEVIVDRRDAIRKALEIAELGDVVVVAGKGHEGFQEIGNRTVPFDDRNVISEELKMLEAVR